VRVPILDLLDFTTQHGNCLRSMGHGFRPPLRAVKLGYYGTDRINKRGPHAARSSVSVSCKQSLRLAAARRHVVLFSKPRRARCRRLPDAHLQALLSGKGNWGRLICCCRRNCKVWALPRMWLLLERTRDPKSHPPWLSILAVAPGGFPRAGHQPDQLVAAWVLHDTAARLSLTWAGRRRNRTIVPCSDALDALAALHVWSSVARSPESLLSDLKPQTLVKVN